MESVTTMESTKTATVAAAPSAVSASTVKASAASTVKASATPTVKAASASVAATGKAGLRKKNESSRNYNENWDLRETGSVHWFPPGKCLYPEPRQA